MISFPQSGTGLPADLAARMTDEALALPDTCRSLDRFWLPIAPPRTRWISPSFSRLVVDLNRQPEPGTIPIPNPTPICAVATFDGSRVYRAGGEPGADEIAERVQRYWEPFHRRLGRRLSASQRRSGFAVLLDAHSIAPEQYRFAGGPPPPVAVKTGGGRCCSPALRERLRALCADHPAIGATLDDPGIGGYLVHRHADPPGISAVQVEVREDLYLKQAGLDVSVRPSDTLVAFGRDLIACLIQGDAQV